MSDFSIYQYDCGGLKKFPWHSSNRKKYETIEEAISIAQKYLDKHVIKQKNGYFMQFVIVEYIDAYKSKIRAIVSKEEVKYIKWEDSDEN